MYTLTLTQEQLQIIDAAVGEMPYKHSAGVVNEIRTQLVAQTQKQSEAPIEKTE